MNTEITGNEQMTAEPVNIDREQKEELTVIDFKMITFSLAGKDYAIDIMKVKEIAKAGRFTYVPNALPFVRGVYNLRGDIIPIIDFRLFFNIEIAERKEDELENLLIVSVGDQTFGIVVDEIDSVVGIQKSNIQPPHPLFGDINIKYIYGVVESKKHLYILLDIDRIFTTRMSAKSEKKAQKTVYVQADRHSDQVSNASEKTSQVSQKTKVSVKSEAVVENGMAAGYGFVVSGLESLKKFYVSDPNEAWVRQRFDEWGTERAGKSVQLQNVDDADEFLKPFWSPYSDTWWSDEYADSVYKLFPDNSAKQIVVWNPGCGKGFETYSLACLLRKRYPDSKLRIYAHDIDLLNVSNAPLLTVPEKTANSWYAPYVSKKANGEYTFTEDIKSIIMFEYHDCTNTNTLPVIDIVFARDFLSLIPKSAQRTVFGDFEEKIKGNGIVILGKNESLAGRINWNEKKVGSLLVYSRQ